MGLRIGPVKHGWLYASFSPDSSLAESLGVVGSYVNGEPAEDLLDAVSAMIRRSDVPILCHWYTEPDYYTWYFVQREGSVFVALYHGDSPVRLLPSPSAKFIAQISSDLWTFVLQIDRSYFTLLDDDHGQAYRLATEKDFPHQAYARFRKAAKELADRFHLVWPASYPPQPEPDQVRNLAIALVKKDDDTTVQLAVANLATLSMVEFLHLVDKVDPQQEQIMKHWLAQGNREYALQIIHTLATFHFSDKSMMLALEVVEQYEDSEIITQLLDLLRQQPSYLVAYSIALILIKWATLDNWPILLEAWRYSDNPNHWYDGFAYNIWDAIEKKVLAIGQERPSIFIEALHDPHFNVRKYIAKILGTIGGNVEYVALVAQIHDDHALVRAEIARALAKIKGQAAIPLLTELLTDQSGEVRKTLLRLLEQLHVDRFDELLRYFLQDPDWRVRHIVTTYIPQYLGSEALPLLQAQLRDADHVVKLAALMEMRKIGGSKALRRAQKIVNQTEPLEFGGGDLRMVIKRMLRGT